MDGERHLGRRRGWVEGDQQGQADTHVHESSLAAQQRRNVGKSKAAHQSKMHSCLYSTTFKFTCTKRHLGDKCACLDTSRSVGRLFTDRCIKQKPLATLAVQYSTGMLIVKTHNPHHRSYTPTKTHSDKTVADPWSWMGKYYEYKGASPTKPSTARNRRLSYRCRSSSANASAYMSTTDLD